MEFILAQFGVVEDVDTLLVNLLHNLAKLLVGENLVALEVNLANTHLLVLVDHKGYIDCIVDYAVILDSGYDLHVSPTLVDVVVFDLIHTLFDVVVAESFRTSFEFQFIREGCCGTLADTLKEPAEDAGAFREDNVQIDTVANGGCKNLHIRKVLFRPKFRNGVRNLPARDGNLLSLNQARRVDLQLWIEEFDTLGRDFANRIALGCRIVGNRGV